MSPRSDPQRKVALLAHPSAELYGSDRVFLESVEGLTADGWRVVVTLPVGGPLVGLLESAGAEVALSPTAVLRKRYLNPFRIWILGAISLGGLVRGWLLVRRVKPDVLYVSTMTIPLWPILGRLRKVPVIAHVHEAEASASRPIRIGLALPMILADTIVVNSAFSDRVLGGSIRRLLDRTEIVHNAVPGPPELVPARKQLDGTLKVLYVGRLSPRKGVDVAVSAIRSLRLAGIDASLDIVGSVFPGYEWYETELRDRVDRDGLADHVTFHGFRDSVWGDVAASDVLVVPSRTDEPFGNTAVEAILGGRPVVASRTSGLMEATDGYRCATTVVPDDPGALASALEDVMSDWDAITSGIGGDVSRAMSRHSVNAYRARMTHLVASLTRHSAAASSIRV